MSEAYKNIEQGRFSLRDAEVITEAKLLEQTPTLNWESSDANRATRQAALAVGEDASAASFLVARARVVEKMIVAKNPTVKPTALRFTPPVWINAALVGIAFILGLLTDQFASESSRINLLSLPFFGVLLWNILVYVMLLISGIRHKTSRDFLGLRSALGILEKALTIKQVRLTKSITTLLQPFVMHYAARAFHLAALFFVLGMICSVLLRGVGTAYTVGWESTWFANSPDIVYQIIALTYGIFTNFLGPMPNILDVANMRFDRLSVNAVDVSAGLWLMRMIFMLAVFVAVPRLLLALKHTLQINALKKNFPLDLSERYYADILRTWRSAGFPVIRDLMVDRYAYDKIIQAGGFTSVNTGGVPDANAIPIPKKDADLAMDAAACIGCGACAAACKNGSAMLFVSAKVSQLALLPQGKVEATRRAKAMVAKMDELGFGNCTNTRACEMECPKNISVSNIARLNREFICAKLQD